MANILHPDAITALVYGDHGSPRDILGVHEQGDKWVIRGFRPDAEEMGVLFKGKKEPEVMKKLHSEGLFELEIEKPKKSIEYEFVYRTHHGQAFTISDPYSFPLQFGEVDLYLHSQGKHLNIYDKLGAHPMEINGVSGVLFAVWAPNARRMSVVGNFNYWDVRYHPMERHGDSGIWEVFIPGLKAGESYKFAVKSMMRNYQGEKSDPYAFYAEKRPNTASVVVDLNSYQWADAKWMEKRAVSQPLIEPMSIYEVHMGSWMRNAEHQWLTYTELAEKLVPYLKDMGYTHIEMMPVSEHPFDGSWGYQVTGYFAPTSRYGAPEEFMYFVDQCHQNDIGVILDWVPAHFPKDGHALSFFDGTHLYSHEDPRQGEHPDWGTYIFNYGRNEVKNFLIANALFWLKKYHIDGLRVDAVSSMVYLDFSRKQGEWIPNKYGGNENLEAVEFLKEFNMVVHQEVPGAITIAEESTAWAMVSRPIYLGGLGFTFKWNMGWMHDTLKYISTDPIYRRYSHNMMTFSMIYAFSENFVLSLSHDEVVHGKGSLMGKAPGDWWHKFATLRLLLGYQYTHVGKKLNFMGHEIGQWREWSEERQLDWELLEQPTHKGLQNWVKDMNHFYKTQPALYELDYAQAGHQWIEANDADNSAFSFARFATDPQDFLVIVCNFTPIVRSDYRVGVPQEGHYVEVMNSDSEHYGGSNAGNYGGRDSQAIAWHRSQHSISLTLPPLSMLILKLQAKENK
jgi:1,4-alpha-glucan branching enzyme